MSIAPGRSHIIRRSEYIEGHVTLTVHTPCCHTEKQVTVDRVGFQSWIDGELIQNALPNSTPDQRELLMTGNCGPCWDMMFSDEY